MITFLCMITTVIRIRKLIFRSCLKNIIRESFSVIYITSSSHKNKVQDNKSKQNASDISSDLCANNKLAKIDKLPSQQNVELYSVTPKLLVTVSNWLNFPRGKSLFPLNTDNCYEPSDALSNCKLNILIEAAFPEHNGSKVVSNNNKIKLEDYGLIITWILNKNINFILESNTDHFIDFISKVMKGYNYINNDLFITRIQSVSVSGEPCTYEISSDKQIQLNSEPINKIFLYTLSNIAQIAVQQENITEFSNFGIKIHPHLEKDNSDNVSDFFIPLKNNSFLDDDIESNSSDASLSDASSPDTSSPDVSSPCIDKDENKAIQRMDTKDAKDELLLRQTAIKENVVTCYYEDISIKPSNNQINFIQESASNTISKEENFKEEKKPIKPPNILIYADSVDTINNVKTVLESVLDLDRYIIYALTRDEARSNSWINQVILVVVCGNVDTEVSAQLVEYVIHGGKLLALCSDILHTLLPTFKTAEVRESELVHFSYGKWKRVRMMHHIFCYHASPIRAHFSQDHEDSRTSPLNPPMSTNIKDKTGKLHSFDVKVLGTEETWNNPSILLATFTNSGGKVIFSQIHLEIDPMQYEYEEDKFNALKKSNDVRLEIIGDLLSTHLEMKISQSNDVNKLIQYTSAYFLGMYEIKMKLLDKLKNKMQNNILKLSMLDIGFYMNNVDIIPASASFLPIMVHMCPANFSTLNYFENLNTNQLGRLVIYTDVLKSSMYVTEDCLEHGLAVISRYQTEAYGRGRNKWLGPMGCAMFTLQVHIEQNSILGDHISLLQHIAAVALVSAVRSRPGYEDLDLRLKWPNDVYIGNSNKIGGLIVPAQLNNSLYICNIGAGINLFNSKPTTCINDVIEQYNQKYGKNLLKFSYEQYLAYVFNELENLLNVIQNNNIQHFYNLYYKYWLHKNSRVTVIKSDGKAEKVTILSINDYGYLMVLTDDGSTFPVHPDGNSFDLLKGLIISK